MSNLKNKNLEEYSLETVKMFYDDAIKSNLKMFCKLNIDPKWPKTFDSQSVIFNFNIYLFQSKIIYN